MPWVEYLFAKVSDAEFTRTQAMTLKDFCDFIVDDISSHPLLTYPALTCIVLLCAAK